MSSIILMHTAIPNNKPSKCVDNIISKQNPQLRRSSPTCMRRRRPSSLQLHGSYQLESPPRRTGNYKPTLWDFDRIQSLNSVYKEEKYTTRASELIVQVKKLLEAESDWFEQLELIDQLQKLGLSYHFNEEINQILNSIYFEQKYYSKTEERDLYSTSLAFRLLRQHGLKVPQDVFDGFKNDKGDFEASLGDDIEGVQQMYEASFLLVEGEMTMEAARVFSTEILQRKLDDGGVDDDEQLSALVRRSLELPLHWCVQRPNARWFIEAYSTRSDANTALLELAKLDFNIVQAAHQNELKQISRWWKETRIAEKLPFARDRLVENYIWNIGLLFEPQYGHARIMTTKLFVLITVIDDVFDVYGTLEETQLFNDTILRWDVEAIEKLPEYMQICYMALDNFINETAYDILKEHGILTIQDLRKSWSDLCSAYAKEAEWYHTEYTPTLDEYMSVAWISISAHTILLWVFFFITNPLEKDVIQKWRNYHEIEIIRCSAYVLRLADDLGTSPFELKRGDVPKAVECYMNEKGGSREEGKQHVWAMLWDTWKKMNEENFGDSPFSKDFMRSAADLGRQAQYMYQHGDGHGIRNREMEERILGLIFHPIV